jgi:putative ABC transport system permease protein
MLVVAAGLFVRTLTRLVSVPLGFDSDRLMVVAVSPHGSTAAAVQADAAAAERTLPARLELYQRMRDVVAAVPGVSHAAASVVTPVSGRAWMMNVSVAGAPPRPESEPNPLMNIVTPWFFDAYGMPIVEGRALDARDTASAPHVAVVNATFAHTFFAGRSALGGVITYANFTTGPPFPPRQIVGVVADSIYRSLRERPRPTIYSPLAQYDNFGNPLAEISLTVRAANGSPAALTRSLAAALLAAEPGLEFSFRPLRDQIAASLAQERLVAALSGFFAALALLLAGLGLYGVTAHAVSRRRLEIGIRLALGSPPASVVGLVLRRVVVMLAAGLAAGALLSIWAGRFVAALLFGVSASDPVTIGGAAALLTAIGLVAGWLPAWRAARSDPMDALRAD